jgi:BMFP domain-containing protein YqiC
MTETSHELINEYKDQVRILKDQVSELESAGKSKDSANKRCLQKLEYANEDNEKLLEKVSELEKKFKSEKKHSKMLSEHP